MINKLIRKDLKELEERLIQEKSLSDHCILSLYETDFCCDSRLSACSYNELKEKAKHINLNEQITISIPRQFSESFAVDLKEYITSEIITLRKNIVSAKRTSLILFLIGVLIFGACKILDETGFFYEFAVVAFWVFEWSAVAKLFFEKPAMIRSKMKLLQLAGAEIVTAETNRPA